MTAFGQRQDCDVTLTADEYFNSMAIAPDEEEARANALNFLTTQISATISATSELVSHDQNKQVDQTFTSQSRTVTRLKLNGVKYATCLRRKKTDPFRVIAYISREDLRRSGQQVATEVGQYLELMSQKKDIGVGFVADAYTAYLTTFTTPFVIADTIDRRPVGNVQAWLESMLRSYISKAELTCMEALPSAGNDGQVTLKIRITGASDPQAKFSLELPAWNARHDLGNEGGPYEVIMQPASTEERFRGVLQLKPSLLSPEYRDLAEILPIAREVEFMADMTSVIGLDIDAVESGSGWIFRPRYRELSIRQVEWFVDGTLYNTQVELRIPRDAVSREVMMRINGQNELTVRSHVQPDGTLARETRAPAKPKTSIGMPSPKPEVNAVSEKSIRSSGQPGQPEDEPVADASPAAKGGLSAPQRELADAGDFQSLTESMRRFRTEGVLQFGRKADFLLPENCWVYLVNPASRKVEHALAPGAVERRDVKSGKTFRDFEQTSSGLIAVWVQFN